jgi:hypothetical protein
VNPLTLQRARQLEAQRRLADAVGADEGDFHSGAALSAVR